MTTGSWSVGISSTNSAFFAHKDWNGADGKYESSGKLKWNAYEMTHYRWTQDPGLLGYAPGMTLYTVMGSIRNAVAWGNAADLRTLNKLAEQVKGHAFDGGINIAEAGRSYNMILKNLRSIGSSLVNLKRGNVSGALRALGQSGNNRRPLQAREVSGRWLEMQYGWRPLVDQAYEAGRALESFTRQRVVRFSASNKRSKLIDLSGTPSQYHVWSTLTYSRKYVAELREDMGVGRSLGLTNPAAVAWEIVPYSFVVDWFIPVGSYLSALGVIPHLTGRFLTIEKGSWVGSRFEKVDPTSAQVNKHLRCRYLYYIRTPSSSLTVPKPTLVSVPQALSPGRIKNAIALIHQRLG
jgi:hypothetical protein